MAQSSLIPKGEPCSSCGRIQPFSAGEKAGLPRKEVFNDKARTTIKSTIETLSSELTEISHYIHSNPELAYKEVRAHAKLMKYLEDKGFTVQSYQSLSTAFRVEYQHGEGGRTFGFNSEYDALPDIGHACGHNLIAVAGLAAFLGLKEAMIKHNIPGKVVLIGTPAEESGGGKIDLINLGAYKDLDACMMVHPFKGPSKTGHVGPSLALQSIKVEYYGKSAHAGVAPWEGINALDAATLAYTSVGVMRQQFKPEVRVHGVITHGGGTAPNVIPQYTQMNWNIRAPTSKELDIVRDKMMNCFEGAAKQTGCKIIVTQDHQLQDLRNDKLLTDEYASTMSESFGINVTSGYDNASNIGGSTDFGIVTYVCPSSHPMYGIPTIPGGLNHTAEFTAVAKGEEAHEETWKAAIGIASVGMRFLGDNKFAEEVTKWWKDDMAKSS
ncbi:uncharacterized protein L201_003812 [Kwoniella dendrophila CBS 6074]|uniref:Peptidase M20 domain-containing protein 2 n=1 Tax=Kwoniella dendrophila CBS 6074 TaxID=1295534 RepID=A0AAX4JU74_9TREE